MFATKATGSAGTGTEFSGFTTGAVTQSREARFVDDATFEGRVIAVDPGIQDGDDLVGSIVSGRLSDIGSDRCDAAVKSWVVNSILFVRVWPNEIVWPK